MKNLTWLGLCALSLVACNSEPATNTPPASPGATAAGTSQVMLELDNTP